MQADTRIPEEYHNSVKSTTLLTEKQIDRQQIDLDKMKRKICCKCTSYSNSII